jgi:hypothetical protein
MPKMKACWKLSMEQFQEGALLLDGCDNCIDLVTTDGVPVYSYDKLLKKFIEDGMDVNEAAEWIDYNVLGLTGNGNFHVAMKPFYQRR